MPCAGAAPAAREAVVDAGLGFVKGQRVVAGVIAVEVWRRRSPERVSSSEHLWAGFAESAKRERKKRKWQEVAGSGREVAPRVSKDVFLEVGRGAEIGVVGRWLFTVGRVFRVCVQGRSCP